MNHARKPLIGLIALGAALAMPLAFAQSEPTDTMDQDAAETTQTQTDPTQQQSTQPTAPTTGAETQQLTWADVDSDKNGSISKTESAQLASLAQVFDEADANADGELTPDEYKAYVAKADAAGADSGGTD